MRQAALSGFDLAGVQLRSVRPALRGAAPPLEGPPVLAAEAVIQRAIKVGTADAVQTFSAAEFCETYFARYPAADTPVTRGLIDYLDHEPRPPFATLEEAHTFLEKQAHLLDNGAHWAPQIVGLAHQLEEKFPPRDHVFISLGRSPSTIVAALSARGCVTASVPLGGLKLPGAKLEHANLSAVPEAERTRAKALIRARLSGVKKYFGGRHLVLLDYTQSGQGLRMGQLLIEDAVRYPVTPVALQAGGFSLPPATTADFAASGMRTMTLPGQLDQPNSLSALIGGSELKPFSDFFHSSLKEVGEGKAPLANPLYRQVLRRFQQMRITEVREDVADELESLGRVAQSLPKVGVAQALIDAASAENAAQATLFAEADPDNLSAVISVALERRADFGAAHEAALDALTERVHAAMTEAAAPDKASKDAARNDAALSTFRARIHAFIRPTWLVKLAEAHGVAPRTVGSGSGSVGKAAARGPHE